jgi:hypothetical protein
MTVAMSHVPTRRKEADATTGRPMHQLELHRDKRGSKHQPLALVNKRTRTGIRGRRAYLVWVVHGWAVVVGAKAVRVAVGPRRGRACDSEVKNARGAYARHQRTPNLPVTTRKEGRHRTI